MPDPWRSVHLTVRHPTHPAKETCLACIEALESEKRELVEALRNQPGYSGNLLAHPQVIELERKMENLYWSTKGSDWSRHRHLSLCVHQTQDTREKAAVRFEKSCAVRKSYTEKSKARKRQAREAMGHPIKQRAVPSALRQSHTPNDPAIDTEGDSKLSSDINVSVSLDPSEVDEDASSHPAQSSHSPPPAPIEVRKAPRKKSNFSQKSSSLQSASFAIIQSLQKHFIPTPLKVDEENLDFSPYEVFGNNYVFDFHLHVAGDEEEEEGEDGAAKVQEATDEQRRNGREPRDAAETVNDSDASTNIVHEEQDSAQMDTESVSGQDGQTYIVTAPEDTDMQPVERDVPEGAPRHADASIVPSEEGLTPRKRNLIVIKRPNKSAKLLDSDQPASENKSDAREAVNQSIEVA